MRLSQVVAGLALFLCTTLPAIAEIELDKLTQCDDIARLWSELRSDGSTFSGGCRQPSGPVERAIFNRLGGHVQHIDLCFLRQSPAHFLDTFSCSYTWNGPDSAGLFCMRATSKQDVTDYLEKHDTQYIRPVKQYLDSASACLKGQGDSSRAPSSLAPVPLLSVGQFAFGFVATKRSDTGASVVIHGYATADPALGMSSQSAFEFVSFYTAPNDEAQTSDADVETRTIGDWSLEVDHASKLSEAMDKGFRQQHIRASVYARVFTVRKVDGAIDDDARKDRRLREWSEALLTELQHHDFEQFSQSQLESAHVGGIDEIKRHLKESLPYGQRNKQPFVLGDQFFALLDEWSPDCAGKNGGFGALVISTKPRPLVGSDNGGLLVILWGVDRCSDQGGNTTEFVDDVLQSLEDRLAQVIGE